MDKLLAGLIGRIVMVYQDDIVIYSRSEEEHVQHLELVFARLLEAGLRLKPTKCFFGLGEIKLLGYIVNRDVIHTDPEKVKAIQYRKGKNNIRADMLSRIPPETGIHTIDCDDWVDPTAIPEQDTADVLPLLYDGLDLKEVSKAQHKEFPDILQSLTKDSDEYTSIKGRLFSISFPALNSACYPRLVLPAAYWERVIKRALKEVGHMATGKTLARLREAYVWPDELLKLGEMLLAAYPMSPLIMGIDMYWQ